MKVIQTLSKELNIWDHCLEHLSREIPASQFNTWIQPLEVEWSTKQRILTIFVANRFKLEAVKTQFSKKIQYTVEKFSGLNAQLRFCVQNKAAQSTTAPSLASVDHAPSENLQANDYALASHPKFNSSDDDESGPTDQDRVVTTHTPRHTDLHQSVNRVSRNWQPSASGIGDKQREVAQAPARSSHTETLGQRANHARSHYDPAKLKPDWTFENFVAGTTNRMALAAAHHVATSLGNKDNPLFIYGAVGVGKSHLLHAIGHAVIENQQDAKILYTSSEGFVSDVVRSYRQKTFDDFKDRYHNLDLLLIDDVQFLSGKERTQEEFFHTFEALLSKQSHVVLTSDTYPRALTDMHSRLVSRLDSGLSVAIDPPELEMRVAILIRKAAAEKINLSHDVAFFVARHVRSNVRDLEGALRKIIAMRNLHGNKEIINIATAKDALKDLLMTQNRQLSIEVIQKTVADFYRIKIADMHSKKRPANIAKPRQIAMYLCKELTRHSLPEIGAQFGGRDHTTVLHAVRKIATERKQPGSLPDELHRLEQSLRN